MEDTEDVRRAGLDPGNIEGSLQQHGDKVATSVALEGVRVYMRNNPEGRVLMVSMQEDKLVGEAVSLYRQTAKKVDEDRFVDVVVSGGHGSTQPEELEAIRDFVLHDSPRD